MTCERCEKMRKAIEDFIKDATPAYPPMDSESIEYYCDNVFKPALGESGQESGQVGPETETKSDPGEYFGNRPIVAEYDPKKFPYKPEEGYEHEAEVLQFPEILEGISNAIRQANEVVKQRDEMIASLNKIINEESRRHIGEQQMRMDMMEALGMTEGIRTRESILESCRRMRDAEVEKKGP
jgi:hypothetical protein